MDGCRDRDSVVVFLFFFILGLVLVELFFGFLFQSKLSLHTTAQWRPKHRLLQHRTATSAKTAPSPLPPRTTVPFIMLLGIRCLLQRHPAQLPFQTLHCTAGTRIADTSQVREFENAL